MEPLSGFESADLKLVYRLLHAQLMDHPELVDSELFHALQTRLQVLARQAGVDLANHAEWDRWLGAPEVPCDERIRRRRILDPV
jgi:hypothetical protein